MSGPLLDVRDLVVMSRRVRSVDGVSFRIERGEAYALVGEPGSGSSTLGWAVTRLLDPVEGQVIFDGIDLVPLRGAALRAMRRRLQIVFPDPRAGLDQRRSVESQLTDGLRAHGMAADGARLRELVDAVELPAATLARFPGELTSAQLRRVGIARALAVGPDLLVIDEPVAGLDVSAQARLLNLLGGLRAERGLSYLLIDHDLAVARQLSDRIGVMYRGGLVEEASAQGLHDGPRHPYTRALLAAVPLPDPELEDRREPILLGGDPPKVAPTGGCRFRDRCLWRRLPRCADERPALRVLAARHEVACHYVDDVGRP